jgi:hypothetical protein
MELKPGKSGLALVLSVFVVTATASFAGCASHTSTAVRPSDAASTLSVGDEVQVDRKDGSSAYFKVEKIDDVRVSGSLLSNMFGRNVTIPLAEVDSITLYTKDGVDSGETIEVVSGLLGLALFFSLL